MSSLILPCGQCGQKNRVPMGRLKQSPHCGGCKAPILAFAPLDVDSATLSELIRFAEMPLLVDFWAPWCGPCKTIAPTLKELAASYAGRALILKVNVDHEQPAATLHGISGIPALVFFSSGSERDRLVGAHPKRTIEDTLARVLNRAQAAKA